MKRSKTESGRQTAKRSVKEVLQSIAPRSGFVDVSEELFDLVNEVDALDDDEPKPDDYYGID